MDNQFLTLLLFLFLLFKSYIAAGWKVLPCLRVRGVFVFPFSVCDNHMLGMWTTTEGLIRSMGSFRSGRGCS